MFARLPSPAALRTFEAAARLGSFKAAAAELAVTPTAVSHQIRALEETLGVALFARRTRAVEPTEAGRRLAPAVHAALLGIRDALEEVVEDETVLTVTTTAAFAALRLAPRLPEFEAAWPGLTVRVLTGSDVVDLKRDRTVDVAIRYAAGDHPGLHAVPLVAERFGAYCAPAMLRGPDPVAAGPLFETQMRRPLLGRATWAAWLDRAGAPEAGRRARVVRYDEEQYVLQAAIAGHGPALMSDALVGDVVARGLLAPFRPEIALEGGRYVALCAPDRLGARKIARFLDWLGRSFSNDHGSRDRAAAAPAAG